MKKIIIALAAAASLTACKKISAGGNEGRLKLVEPVTRYSDDRQGTILKRDTAAITEKMPDSAQLKAAPAASAKKEASSTSLSAPIGNSQSAPK